MAHPFAKLVSIGGLLGGAGAILCFGLISPNEAFFAAVPGFACGALGSVVSYFVCRAFTFLKFVRVILSCLVALTAVGLFGWVLAGVMSLWSTSPSSGATNFVPAIHLAISLLAAGACGTPSALFGAIVGLRAAD